MLHRGNGRQRRRELVTFLAGLAGAAAVAAAVCCAYRLATRLRSNPFEGRELECVLDFGHFELKGDILYAGLSYEMLQDFASENGCGVRIRAFTSRESSLDSLRSGAADIVVLPKFDSVLHVSHVDSVAKSHPVCKELCWVMRSGETAGMRRVNSWIDGYTSREEFGEMLERFRLMPSSFRPNKAFYERRQLSPYDSTIRVWADSIGWDWRMLAAVIYTESKFAINVTSTAGAKGLMQLMPLTARIYGVENVLDPEENIRAGASYLGHLDRLFRKYADGEERLKYVFASYNAGETRVLRHLRDVSAAELSDSALREEIDTSVTAYIDRIFENYRNFCRICEK